MWARERRPHSTRLAPRRRRFARAEWCPARAPCPILARRVTTFRVARLVPSVTRRRCQFREGGVVPAHCGARCALSPPPRVASPVRRAESCPARRALSPPSRVASPVSRGRSVPARCRARASAAPVSRRLRDCVPLRARIRRGALVTRGAKTLGIVVQMKICELRRNGCAQCRSLAFASSQFQGTRRPMKTALKLALASTGILFSFVACSAPDEDVAQDQAAANDPCGNGTRDPGEQCDDGNRSNLDGCSSTCQFEQTHRLNTISMMFQTDGFCTSNAIGGAIKSVAQGQIGEALGGAIADGTINVMLGAAGLADPTGAGSGSLSLSSFMGAPSGTALGLDALFTASEASLDADLTPLVSMNASVSGGQLAASGNVAFSLALGAAPADVSLSGAKLKATVGAASAPGNVPASVGLDPSLKTFATLTNGQVCGNVSAASLAAVPVPEQLTTGSTSCSQGYTTSNSMLDVIVGGCRVFIITALGATQPDKADPTVPAAGAGAPYKLTQTGNRVTGCRDKNNASVPLDACLKSAAFSAGFKFTSQRANVRGTSE
ncbi:MAG: hypothetical protein KIT84_00065 [Labilithrix sp.]|nr:hypothetical protein [Labilithrix sp.]MCW5809376.1 hypothetical protein [Labilithrix sp.]